MAKAKHAVISASQEEEKAKIVNSKQQADEGEYLHNQSHQRLQTMIIGKRSQGPNQINQLEIDVEKARNKEKSLNCNSEEFSRKLFQTSKQALLKSPTSKEQQRFQKIREIKEEEKQLQKQNSNGKNSLNAQQVKVIPHIKSKNHRFQEVQNVMYQQPQDLDYFLVSDQYSLKMPSEHFEGEEPNNWQMNNELMFDGQERGQPHIGEAQNNGLFANQQKEYEGFNANDAREVLTRSQCDEDKIQRIHEFTKKISFSYDLTPDNEVQQRKPPRVNIQELNDFNRQLREQHNQIIEMCEAYNAIFEKIQICQSYAKQDLEKYEKLNNVPSNPKYGQRAERIQKINVAQKSSRTGNIKRTQISRIIKYDM